MKDSKITLYSRYFTLYHKNRQVKFIVKNENTIRSLLVSEIINSWI